MFSDDAKTYIRTVTKWIHPAVFNVIKTLLLSNVILGSLILLSQQSISNHFPVIHFYGHNVQIRSGFGNNMQLFSTLVIGLLNWYLNQYQRLHSEDENFNAGEEDLTRRNIRRISTNMTFMPFHRIYH